MSHSSSTPFTVDNIPFGVISTNDNPNPRCATALGHDAIDLSALESDGFFDAIPEFCDKSIFSKPYLNDFAGFFIESRRQARHLLRGSLLQLREDETQAHRYFIALSRVKGYYPMQTNNFSDFYCSQEHAQNLHSSPKLHHCKDESLNVETTLTRPHGVFKDDVGEYTFTPTKKSDMELEMGVFISKPLIPGQVLDIKNVADHIFGFVILTGFGTSISPWIVTMDALAAVKSAVMIKQDPGPLPHLTWKGNDGDATLDIHLPAHSLRNEKLYDFTETNLNELYWTPFQQLTHLDSAGEGLTTGDIFGTGTISSARVNADGEKVGLACLVERSLPHTSLSCLKEDGILWFEDGDEVIMEGFCTNKATGCYFGFGQCRTTNTPAVKLDL
ncbi:hypothetical protein BO83DRAFT_419942 [Aspergillus eucalypticola CBS 122712]|uniref:Fumarylacetoacetase n=1 Tax=Aspergillus eucalypticola (strain CBS 122712 / IBT 29274) TaxID=1448314 RepID=A0A317UTK1_ASPEC|nr:uncharacterized protein BO83DRAFT_419942 [Aspergillus eucalypticola CBS 122712]PWY65413.1 hypothetical protein BO83DRAFT_419942 [Aspergillus eucalypticola CBS 122712]